MAPLRDQPKNEQNISFKFSGRPRSRTLLDTQYSSAPFYDSRKMAKVISLQNGLEIKRKSVQRLMRVMAITAIYRKPNTSKPRKENRIDPYFLPNHQRSHVSTWRMHRLLDIKGLMQTSNTEPRSKSIAINSNHRL